MTKAIAIAKEYAILVEKEELYKYGAIKSPKFVRWLVDENQKNLLKLWKKSVAKEIGYIKNMKIIGSKLIVLTRSRLNDKNIIVSGIK